MYRYYRVKKKGLDSAIMIIACKEESAPALKKFFPSRELLHEHQVLADYVILARNKSSIMDSVGGFKFYLGLTFEEISAKFGNGDWFYAPTLASTGRRSRAFEHQLTEEILGLGSRRTVIFRQKGFQDTMWGVYSAPVKQFPIDFL